MESKIVFTTTSVSFFEMCGVCSATFSIRPLFVMAPPHRRRAPGTLGAGTDEIPRPRVSLRVFLLELVPQQIAERTLLARRLLRGKLLQRLSLFFVVHRLDRQ